MAPGMMIHYPPESGERRISFRGYVERDGRPVMERLDASIEEMAEASRLIETYTMRFVILADAVITRCRLPQLG